MKILLSFTLLISAASALPGRSVADPSVEEFAAESLAVIWDRLDHFLHSQSKDHLYITANDPDPETRKAEIEDNAEGYGYGPPKLGETSYFPNGTLAEELVARQQAEWYADQAPFALPVEGEQVLAKTAVRTEGDNLNELDKFKTLYEHQWEHTVPDGVSKGALSNYTEDLYFSMSRLSGNPFSLHRVHPTTIPDTLPFTIPDDICTKISGSTFSDLVKSGRMFIMDHSYFADPEYMKHRFEDRYAAATTSLFYLTDEDNEEKRQFLPLAIKMGVGEDLVYTKLDGEYEWLLAKIAANSNDFFFGQIYHLISTHAIAEIVNLAAMRTVAGRHPVRVYLERVMNRAYAVRPIGETVLFNEGGLFDGIFSLSSKAVLHFAKINYPSAGRFQSTYFTPELVSRGLINFTHGPDLPHFPFHRDMSIIHTALHDFAKVYVDEYYDNDETLKNDTEIVAWWDECNGPAKVLDFPATEVLSKETLVDVLTHMAYLAGPKHASLNMGTPFTTSGVLPFFPAALYRPLPEKKGSDVVNAENIVDWLPNPQQSIKQCRLLCLFNRPEEMLKAAGGRMMNLWSGSEGMGSNRRPVAKAARKFGERMKELDEEVKRREFGKDGLSQGMPFVYKTLRPGVFPYYLAI